ncbi:riboflavin biosynthesis protein RibF [Ehrlichia chaffeensis str. Heartland]|uniref:Riboflavin biosynthesis protein n=1 Tax=Ehrlichia chaffeensis (strain ATCC CRL-10679 / Arkansas) TaxID=205920 RepID=Q2GFD7_EHRCR|nr:bifunctional riboflavin kinase/FAD synthetase [Ehrlichia chaffeensis]ABD45170.1 riboflavin biosynthesis protein RibF [Ehrlichia chaffeensis str. Arkansas]AHX03288.1 riboflavin biosynthesis protein RibF [Ehrlichia chaffeensis str. Heartland]AHX05204.1 riboflavin biosynthesis protein RibF [Ehrlichia chaffeensis str. Jax]AHX07995.1 riboflavin biosynthesis protein RibF [Ehrlichia chaffeensis str. Osceola]AHX09398.1 riboflavin biosynthesis protein RibF [Ehrlichia chaffeensis str. Wakulla]
MKIIYGYPNQKGNVNSVLAFGNFDGIHLGHQSIINAIKNISVREKITSVVITFSPHPAEYLRNKQNFLLLDLEQKIELLQSYGIDYLYIIDFNESFAQLSPDAFIKDVLVNSCRIKYIVVGHSCFFGHKCLGNIDLLYSYANIYDYEIVRIDPIFINDKLCSSSLIREYLSEGKVDLASKILGRPYQINGKVIKGLARGRVIGFPTVNVDIKHILVPRVGVYSACIKIDDNNVWLNGIVNIGFRPTFNDLSFPILEMHIFDFDSDIYNQHVAIQLLDFIRPERKFSSIEQLKQQINEDIIQVKKSLKYIGSKDDEVV